MSAQNVAHTPGPWTQNGLYVWANDDHKNIVCATKQMSPTNRGRQERDANARLIAAAPELLAACKALADCPTVKGLSGAIRDHAETRKVPDELAMALAAIAEAEDAETEKWLIWSNEHGGWWAPNSRGYVKRRADAGRYTFQQALKIVRNANQCLSADQPNEAICPEWQEWSAQ